MSDKKDYQLDLLHRPRRLRQTQSLRDLVEETDLKVSKLIQPLFVIEGESIREPVASMPGIERLSIDLLINAAPIGWPLIVTPKLNTFGLFFI